MSKPVPITVAHGDGIGPEIMAATLHVLREVDRLVSLGLTFEEVPIGFPALKAHGSTLPDEPLVFRVSPAEKSRINNGVVPCRIERSMSGVGEACILEHGPVLKRNIAGGEDLADLRHVSSFSDQVDRKGLLSAE